MKILVAGELNVDLVLQNYHSFPTLGHEVLVDDVSLTLGSASAICASGLAKLGDSVTFADKLGQDAWGEMCLGWLKDLGIDCSLVSSDPAIKTGITVSLTHAKDRALVTYLGSIAELREEDLSDDDLRACRHLHVSSFFLQHALRPRVKHLLARAHAAGLSTSLDPGFDPSERWGADLIDALEEVDVFLPNDVELKAITGKEDPAAALEDLENGRTLTIAKLGAEGCAARAEGSLVRIPAFPVEAVDTTGAGDSFNAGFLHAWLAGAGPAQAMRFGAACGALSTLALGGTTSQPTEKEAHDFICAQTARTGGTA